MASNPNRRFNVQDALSFVADGNDSEVSDFSSDEDELEDYKQPVESQESEDDTSGSNSEVMPGASSVSTSTSASVPKFPVKNIFISGERRTFQFTLHIMLKIQRKWAKNHLSSFSSPFGLTT